MDPTISLVMEFRTSDFNRAMSLCHEASPVPDALGQTALFYAVQRSDDVEAKQIAERLISMSEIDPKRKDFGGQSPLFYASAVGNIETVKMLISHGCDANEKDNLNQSALFYAARDGRASVAEVLLAHGAIASDIDRNGQTPLFYAARENKKEVCKLLIDANANVDHRDLTGRRASYFSRLNNHVEVTELLESYSVDDSGSDRKRYRLVFVGQDGTHLTPTAEQLEFMESKFPDICVWSKTGPIATGLAPLPVSVIAPGSIAGASAAVARKSSVAFPKKKAVAAPPPPAPKPIWMTAARQIVSDIFKKEDAWIFLRPVDPLKDQCPDYLTVIKNPIDFGTIRKKISKYNSKSEFTADCELVFANCRIYNKPGTLPAVLCERVDSFYKQLVEQYSFDALPDTTGSPTKELAAVATTNMVSPPVEQDQVMGGEETAEESTLNV